MEIIASVAAIPLFRGLTPEQYDQLGTIATVQQFERGQTIFSEGAAGAGFFVVQSGRVKIYKLSIDGKEQILHVFGPGEPFAEVAVFLGAPFPAHAMALERSSCYFFPRAAFTGLIASNPSLAMNMLASLSIRLRQFAHMIEDLSLKEVPGRLAAHLLFLSSQQDGGDRLRLHITKAQLASLLGTIPETLSRILAKLQKQGIIAADGAEITIIDRERLEELASGEARL
ncbi:MAG: Crp/Fnr family transcriptional regulator [Desulfobacteraceae bacterium]|nr:Crp/Fnr family transcriptional regulator [Desulfobacteraceae bacterium]